MARRKAKKLKEIIVEVLKAEGPLTEEEAVARIRRRRPRTRARIIKALLTRLAREGVIKYSNGKYSV